MSLEFATKQPREVLDYDVDFSEWFAATPGDDIELVVVEIEGGSGAADDLATVSTRPAFAFGVPELAPPQYVKVWLEGGVDGVTYKVTVRITTEGGRVKEYDFNIRVKER
jgi:hypothetical protein